MKIDLDLITNIIQGQLQEIANNDENYELYKDVRIICSLEQQFMKIRDKDRNAIYIVIRFGSTSVVFSQAVLPVSIIALSEDNKLELARSLLMQYALTYNLKRVQNETIQQIYEAPSVSSNFEPVYYGFRSVITETGVFVISPNVNFFRVLYIFNHLVDTNDLYAPQRTTKRLIGGESFVDLCIDTSQGLPQSIMDYLDENGSYTFMTYNQGTTKMLYAEKLGDFYRLYNGTQTVLRENKEEGGGTTKLWNDHAFADYANGVLVSGYATINSADEASWNGTWIYNGKLFSFEEGHYYAQYRDPLLQKYIDGAFYMKSGDAIVNASGPVNEYEVVDLYNYDYEMDADGTYYRQSSEYGIQFENGNIYYFDGNNFTLVDMLGVRYWTTGTDFDELSDITAVGYYKYVGNDQRVPYNDILLYLKNGAYYYFDGENIEWVLSEEPPSLATSLGLVNSPDTQAFYNVNDFTNTQVRFGAVSVNMTTFEMNNSALINTITDMICENEGVTVNHPFWLVTAFKDGRARLKLYRCVNIGISQELGQIPALALSFVE